MEAEKNRMRMHTRDENSAKDMKIVKSETRNETHTGICPNCGAENDPTSIFCEQCGTRLREQLCPSCGAPLEEGADFCERCKHYIDKIHCPYCHGIIKEDEVCCSNCGELLSGIVCPICHTKGQFSFCEACGTPLTAQAKQLAIEVWKEQPYGEKIQKIADELEQLWMVQPVNGDREKHKVETIEDLRQRVFDLLNYADAELYAKKPEEDHAILGSEDLKQQILNKQEALQALLDSMAMTPQKNSAVARNYAMASKPTVSRLAWKCNYKRALHKSPLGCACPQCGGKWIVLGGTAHLVNDNK